MAHGMRIESRPEKEYLRLSLYGDFPVDPAEQSEFYAEVNAVSEAAGRMRVLADMRGVARRLDVPGIFEYVVRNFPTVELRPVRVAVLDLPEHLAKGYFYETLMHNRGLDYRLFKDEEQALAWLLA